MNSHVSVKKTPRKALPPAFLVWLCVVTLLSINAVFLLGNIAYRLADGVDEGIAGVFSAEQWEGDHDGSYIEIWGHIQLFAAAIVLGALAYFHRSFLLGAWAFGLMVVVADDLLTIHEELGEFLAHVLNMPAIMGLRSEDFGEMATWALLAVVVVVPLIVGYTRAGAWERAQNKTLLVIMSLLVVFALGLDMFSIIVGNYVPGPVQAVVALAETTGEIIPMSLFLAFAVKVCVQPDQRQ